MRPSTAGFLTNQVLVDVQGTVVSRLERDLGEGADLRGIESEAAVLRHRLHQFVEDLGDGEHLLLADAEEVVVERRPETIRPRGILQAGPWHQRPPAELPGPATIARRLLASAARATAGPPVDYQEPNALMVEKRGGGFQGRRSMIVSKVLEADRLANRPVESWTPSARDVRPRRMRVEDDRVA